MTVTRTSKVHDLEPKPQTQFRQPGRESEMDPAPQSFMEHYKAAGKLTDKVAIVTGGDSGIGRAVAIGFAKEGADVAIVYLEEHDDAQTTAQHIEAAGRRALLIPGDLGDPSFCRTVIEQVVKEFGKLDILVNNAAEQHEETDFSKISVDQIENTFRTNILSMMFLTKAAIPHLKRGAAIINTTSVTSYRGSGHLIDYAATKGAITAFTRSLSQPMLEKGIRVNAVAPGPIWTPFIPSTFSAEETGKFGKETPMKRPGQPDEVAPAYIFLASEQDSSYIAGQVIHPNGGSVVNA